MTNRQNSLAGARVLVVEDEFLIADDLARALRRCGAEPVGPVGTISDAHRLITNELPDAAILDLNLHGVNAAELVEHLADNHVPCLIVSGYGERSFPQGLRAVASLEKPVSYDQVTKKLADVIQAKPAGLSS